MSDLFRDSTALVRAANIVDIMYNITTGSDYHAQHFDESDGEALANNTACMAALDAHVNVALRASSHPESTLDETKRKYQSKYQQALARIQRSMLDYLNGSVKTTKPILQLLGVAHMAWRTSQLWRHVRDPSKKVLERPIFRQTFLDLDSAELRKDAVQVYVAATMLLHYSMNSSVPKLPTKRPGKPLEFPTHVPKGPIRDAMGAIVTTRRQRGGENTWRAQVLSQVLAQPFVYNDVVELPTNLLEYGNTATIDYNGNELTLKNISKTYHYEGNNVIIDNYKFAYYNNNKGELKNVVLKPI